MSGPASSDGTQSAWRRPLGRLRRGAHPSILSDAAAGRLLPVQAMHTVGETMFAVSLAGSLFFNVTVDAARPRILLFLALTMAPFVVLAPLVGQVIDRVRGGHRVVLLLTLAGRAGLALLLADQLRGLLFYPEAFVMLVLAKTYAVSRNTIVPILVDRSNLLIVNSRLARTATIAGAVAAPIAVLVLRAGGAGWVLRVGAVAYGLGALLALRLPPPHPDLNTSPVVEQTELSGPGVRSATLGMAAVRAAIGFSLFHIGFVMKQAGEPAWLFGGLAVASAAGAFVGTFVAPRLRPLLSEQPMLTAALALPGLMALITTLRFHRVSILVFVLSLGVCGSVARRAFDGVVQTEAPHARRGKAYAGLETRLELAWVLGALAAVVARAPAWLGIASLTAWLGAVAVYRVVQRRGAARIGAGVGPRTLPLRLLETAEALAARGDREQAALVAVAAADAVAVLGSGVGPGVEQVRRLAEAAVNRDDVVAADQALRLAHELVAEAFSAAAVEDAG